jgi:hypothetical protein
LRGLGSVTLSLFQIADFATSIDLGFDQIGVVQ